MNGKKKNKIKIDTDYAHNPRYCMIYPDSAERDDDNIVTGNES